jgi:DNA polymerase IV
MRIAFVAIPRFACAVEVQRDPLLASRPLVVGDAEQPKKVLDCSSDAHCAGVQPGMAIRKALALCPEAIVLSPDPVLYRSRWEAVLDALDPVTPEIEDAEMGQAYLNVGGLQRHYRDEADLGRHIVDSVQAASGLGASVGIAEGKFPAFAVASVVLQGQTGAVAQGEEAEFLASLSVGLLPVEEEIVSRLRLLGLETIGEVARLSLPELESQFGFEGKRLWQLANGIDETPLISRSRTESVAASVVFEAEVAGIDVLIAASKQLLSRLRLPLRGRAAREMSLQAELASGRGWERRLVFREPVSENERLVFLLRSALTNFPPPQAVRSLTLRMSGLTGETGKQLSLGERGRLHKQLEEAIRQLKARYGFSPIYHCVDVEPWSVVPEERQILVESDA